MSLLRNICYISDLHWNVWCRNYATHIFRFIMWNRITEHKKSNNAINESVLVISGDISPLMKTDSFSWFHTDILNEIRTSYSFLDIVWHAGNHEFDTSKEVTPYMLEKYRQIEFDTQTRFLHRSIYRNRDLYLEIGGCILWTPKRYKEEYMYDLEFIRYYSHKPKEIGWRRLLSTHYLPIPELIHNKYKKYDNSNFANDLFNLQCKIAWNHIDVSICGHTHEIMTVHKYVGDSHRVDFRVCPMGYPIEEYPSRSYNKN